MSASPYVRARRRRQRNEEFLEMQRRAWTWGVLIGLGLVVLKILLPGWTS
jgi:hypothetical protein